MLSRMGKAPVACLAGFVSLSTYAQQNGDIAGAGPHLEEVTVTAHQRDYRADSASSAAGLDLTLLETPAAVSIITQDILKDQQVNNVDDALRNVAGVTKFKTGNGGEEKFSIRGFDASQSIYKDGARINNALNASNIPSTETANIERIEVLKGPSALLYGQGEPGGIINYITKRPQLQRYTNIEVLTGSDSLYKVEFDTTGALSAERGLAYRFVGAYEDSESFRDEVFRRRLLLNPSVAFMPNDRLSLVLGYEYLDDNYTQDRGQVLDGNIVRGYSYSGRVDEEQFFGIPNYNDKTEAESNRIYLNGEYAFSDGWRMEATFSQTDNDKTNVDSSPGFLTADFDVIGPAGSPDENLVSIQPRKTVGEGEARQAALKQFIDFEGPAGIQHQILASLTWEDFETRTTSFRGDRNVFFNVASGEYFTAFDAAELNDPDIIRATDTVVFRLNPPNSSTSGEFEERGINVLDYIRFNQQFSVLLGGRYSEYEDITNDFTDEDFSLRAGLVYAPVDGISFYLSYSEGYTPSGGLLAIDEGPVDPETSVAWELGAKWSLRDEQLLITAAVYDIDLEDVPFVTNPLDADGNPTPEAERRYDNLGAIASRGIELEVVGRITENWRVQAGYAYIDSEIAEGGVGEFGAAFPEGNRLPGIAENNVNLFTFYEFALAGGELGLGGGVFYQDEVYISTENRGRYDAWTQIDLAAYYKRERWKAQLNIRNAFDEDYRLAQALTTSDFFAAIRVGTSMPRTLTASLAYEF